MHPAGEENIDNFGNLRYHKGEDYCLEGELMKRMPIEVVFTNERIISPSGLSIVGGMLGKSDFVKRCNRIPVSPRRSEAQIKDGDILLTYIGLLCQGKTDFEAVRETQDDPDYYKEALGITRAIPSAETLRQRMDDIGDSLRGKILQANADMFTAHGIAPSALPNDYVNVDCDVSPFDNTWSHKEGVSRTYKGCDGYAPMFAYIGAEGFMLNCELREGRQHSQKGTPAFLRESIRMARQITDKPLLFRLDSGNDAADNIGLFLDAGVWFIIKRNLRLESKEGWFENVREVCRDVRHPRDGKTVYIGSSWKEVTYASESGEKKTACIRIGYEITERTIDKHGQVLLIPDIEVNTWWTNLGWTDQEVIESYHAHAECEQYHSELKTDMDVERLPSGKFATNALVLELAMIAFNLLRMIGQESLKHKPDARKKVRRRRLRTVIQNLMLCAGHVTQHARKLCMGLGRSNTWRFAFMEVFRRFCTA